MGDVTPRFPRVVFDVDSVLSEENDVSTKAYLSFIVFNACLLICNDFGKNTEFCSKSARSCGE
jgi:hypothetical protein